MSTISLCLTKPTTNSMKLQNSFYTIEHQETQDFPLRYDLQLNAGHTIYQAHFPGKPITPGVCIVQIAVELLEDYLQKPLLLNSVKNIKFLSVISPTETPLVTYTINKIEEQDSEIKAALHVSAGEMQLTKISRTCNAHI